MTERPRRPLATMQLVAIERRRAPPGAPPPRRPAMLSSRRHRQATPASEPGTAASARTISRCLRPATSTPVRAPRRSVAGHASSAAVVARDSRAWLGVAPDVRATPLHITRVALDCPGRSTRRRGRARLLRRAEVFGDRRALAARAPTGLEPGELRGGAPQSALEDATRPSSRTPQQRLGRRVITPDPRGVPALYRTYVRTARPNSVVSRRKSVPSTGEDLPGRRHRRTRGAARAPPRRRRPRGGGHDPLAGQGRGPHRAGRRARSCATCTTGPRSSRPWSRRRPTCSSTSSPTSPTTPTCSPSSARRNTRMRTEGTDNLLAAMQARGRPPGDRARASRGGSVTGPPRPSTTSSRPSSRSTASCSATGSSTDPTPTTPTRTRSPTASTWPRSRRTRHRRAPRVAVRDLHDLRLTGGVRTRTRRCTRGAHRPSRPRRSDRRRRTGRGTPAWLCSVRPLRSALISTIAKHLRRRHRHHLGHRGGVRRGPRPTAPAPGRHRGTAYLVDAALGIGDVGDEIVSASPAPVSRRRPRHRTPRSSTGCCSFVFRTHNNASTRSPCTHVSHWYICVRLPASGSAGSSSALPLGHGETLSRAPGECRSARPTRPGPPRASTSIAPAPCRGWPGAEGGGDELRASRPLASRTGCTSACHSSASVSAVGSR